MTTQPAKSSQAKRFLTNIALAIAGFTVAYLLVTLFV